MGYAWAAAATLVATLVALALDAWFHVVNVALVYLLAVVLIALRFRRGPVIAVSVLNVRVIPVLVLSAPPPPPPQAARANPASAARARSGIQWPARRTARA